MSIVTTAVLSMVLLTVTGKIDVRGEVMPPPTSQACYKTSVLTDIVQGFVTHATTPVVRRSLAVRALLIWALA